MYKQLAVIALSTALTSAALGEQLIDKSHAFNGVERIYIEQECSALNGKAPEMARAGSLGAHAASLNCTGDFEQAIAVYREALKSKDLTERDSGLLYTGLGYSAIAAGKYRYAKSTLRKAVKIFEAAGDKTGAAKAGIWLAKALVLQGHTKDAAAQLETSLATLEGNPSSEKEIVVGNTLLVYAYDQQREDEKAADVVRNFAASGQFERAEATNIPLYGRNPVFRGIAAQAKGQTRGDVTLKFTVAEDGSVMAPEVVSSTSNAAFERAALTAIHNFRFLPSAKNTEAVKYSFHWDVEKQSGINIQPPRPPHGTSGIGSLRFGLQNLVR
jgi:TonB family protein